VKLAAKSTPPPQFIPELKGKKVIIRLVSGGQPITGTVTAYNPHEILFRLPKGIRYQCSTHSISVKCLYREPVRLRALAKGDQDNCPDIVWTVPRSKTLAAIFDSL
jgi:hypothetical protein